MHHRTKQMRKSPSEPGTVQSEQMEPTQEAAMYHERLGTRGSKNVPIGSKSAASVLDIPFYWREVQIHKRKGLTYYPNHSLSAGKGIHSYLDFLYPLLS